LQSNNIIKIEYLSIEDLCETAQPTTTAMHHCFYLIIFKGEKQRCIAKRYAQGGKEDFGYGTSEWLGLRREFSHD
jgi:hypothetical protein